MKRQNKSPDDSAHSRDAKWEWRKNVRVWEANRKVFVRPGNWLEPDLVLPDACLVVLRQVVAAVRAQCATRTQRIRNPKLACPNGVPVLFIGKNPADALVVAQYLATALRMDLYRIDLCTVVSKSIGETEKQLRHVFDVAENSGAILFFDEADALFGKRSGVKNSHDRYAKIEVNYLLQRLEDPRGLAILTTGGRRGLDEAILKRFDFVIRALTLRKRGSTP